MKDSPYLSIPQLARVLGISRIALYKKVKSGQIKAVRIGKNFAISRSYIEKNIIDLKESPLNDAERVALESAVRKAYQDFGGVFSKLGRQ